MTTAKEVRAEAEAEKVINWMYSVRLDLARTRVTKAVAQNLLLRDTLFIRGLSATIESKPVGAGIYEVWLKEKVY